MFTLRVPDMTCGHCAQTVEKAVKSVDPSAEVKVDLAQKTVTVETSAEEKRISDVVRSPAMRIRGWPREETAASAAIQKRRASRVSLSRSGSGSGLRGAAGARGGAADPDLPARDRRPGTSTAPSNSALPGQRSGRLRIPRGARCRAVPRRACGVPQRQPSAPP